ncbi:MAG TPA: hypothetical protein VGY32_09065 [Solirubrobacteraceae bacterium]|nr:hypothetical protein [Solirubrobacteraceae bacterium]
MRTGLVAVIVLASLLACASASAQPSLSGVITDGIDGAARQASCRALTGGTTGVPETPSPGLPDRGNGLAAGAPSNAPRSLPGRLVLRTTRTTFNRRYWFALDQGRVWYRSNTDVTGIAQPWTELPTPPCFEGQVTGISADDDELIAIDSDRRVYTMDGALGDPAQFNWTSRWGPPFWTGAGRTLPPAIAWSWSVVSPNEDGNWTDPAGNTHGIGAGKVSHIWALSDQGQRLTFMDPWLPDDESYEMCGPRRGRFRSVAMSASGSTVFVVGRHGDMYTRIYDFDLSGDDSLFFTYSYEDQRGQANPAIQLPAAAWVHQPKIPGRITSAISIEKVGPNVVHRTLRVEGLDRRGRTGYWEKDIVPLSAGAWRFHVSGLPLQGRPLANRRRDTSALGFGPVDGGHYVLHQDGFTASLQPFDGTCTPTVLSVALSSGRRFKLLLHTTDQIRQTPRGRGFDEDPRGVSGTIEAPPAVLNSSDPAVKAWVARWLIGRFTTADLQATTSRLVFPAQGWTFTARR